MRGDGPFGGSLTATNTGFPPHARGWTVEPQLVLDNAHVSPACAGMDLTTGPFHEPASCFPRMRGDGPRSWESAVTPSVFPPHARGWTTE